MTLTLVLMIVMALRKKEVTLTLVLMIVMTEENREVTLTLVFNEYGFEGKKELTLTVALMRKTLLVMNGFVEDPSCYEWLCGRPLF